MMGLFLLTGCSSSDGNGGDTEGILDNVTTRGLETSAWDMIVNGWGSTAKNRRIKILDMLEANKVMGNADAQQELFNALPTKLKKGETNAKQWFINLNQKNVAVGMSPYLWEVHHLAYQVLRITTAILITSRYKPLVSSSTSSSTKKHFCPIVASSLSYRCPIVVL